MSTKAKLLFELLMAVDLGLTKILDCCYGEHKLQKAALYALAIIGGRVNPLAVSKCKLDQRSTNPSSINLEDLNRNLFLANRFFRGLKLNGFSQMPYVAIVCKHNNCCGFGVSTSSPLDALRKAIGGDPKAAFGGSWFMNFEITLEMAQLIQTYLQPKGRRTLDVILAPSFTPEARDYLAGRKEGKCRVYTNSSLADFDKLARQDCFPRIVSLQNELLIQEPYPDAPLLHAYTWYNATDSPADDERIDWILLQALLASMTSNTIVLVRAGQLLGAGIGQPSRIGALNVALLNARQAGHDVTSALMGSDSFAPFDDVAKKAIRKKFAGILTTAKPNAGDKEPTVSVCTRSKLKPVLVIIDDARGRFFSFHC